MEGISKVSSKDSSKEFSTYLAKNFSKKLSSILKTSGLVQREFAKKLHISEHSLRLYLSGEKQPRIDILCSIAKIFKVSLAELGFKKVKVLPSFSNVVQRKGTVLSNNDREEFVKILKKYKEL